MGWLALGSPLGSILHIQNTKGNVAMLKSLVNPIRDHNNLQNTVTRL